MKKIVAVLICVMLLASLMPLTAFAENTSPSAFSEGMYNDVSGSSIGRYSSFPWAAVIAMPIFIAAFVIYAKIKAKKEYKDKEQTK